MGEEIATENGSNTVIKLNTEVSNGIRHAVATLDQNSSGKVAKSQLQAIVANVCQAIKVTFVSDDLENYLPDSEDISVAEFLDFLENKLLVKGKKLIPKEMDELSWVVVGQKYEEDPHTLTKKDAFKLWLVFKKLDVGGECRVDVEELCIILEKFVRGIGVQWNEQHLIEFAEDGALTFWKFIDCLERKFLVGVDKSVLREGLQELFDFILDEVTKTGFLSKKGHGFLQGQKSRWYALKPDKLTYYVSSGYREKKGDIILNNESKVTSIPDKGSNKCRFLVTCGLTKKDFEQTAPDQRTKQAWMTDIQTAIDCFGGDTPLKRDLLARKAKRDEDRARKAEEERKRREQEDLLDQQRKEIDLLKKRKEEIEKYAEDEKAALDAEIKRREELEEIQRNLQQLLEDQKRAREEDEKIRAAKERLLEEERVKREQLEALRQQQQQELQNEKMQKEELMEKQKEQERILEEERKRLQHLEEERMKAEEAAKAAKDKLNAAETAAKNAAEQAKDRVRQLKTSIGLKGTVGPKVDPLVSHRGKGAFTLEEFLNRATEWSGLPLEDEERARSLSSAPEVDELTRASATPASNQNIPEFLKKAAAWSGLNPDTYLEGAEGKKNSPPPKVAVKPPKPLPSAAAVETTVDVQGKQASLEDNKVPQEGEQASQEDNQVPNEGEQGSQKDDEVLQENKEVRQEGNEVPQEVPPVGEKEISQAVDEVFVHNDGAQVKEDEGSEGASIDKPQVVAVDDKEHEGVESSNAGNEGDGNDATGDKKSESEDDEGSQMIPADSKEETTEGNDVTEVVDGNIIGSQNKESSENSIEQSTDPNYSSNVRQNAGIDETKKEEIKSEEKEIKDNEESGESLAESTANEHAEQQNEISIAKEETKTTERECNIEKTDLVAEETKSEEVAATQSEDTSSKNEPEKNDAHLSNIEGEGLATDSKVSNAEPELADIKQEVKDEKPERYEAELKEKKESESPGEVNDKHDESEQDAKESGTSAAESKESTGNQSSIVENGESCKEKENGAEQPNNNEDSKCELSEKCAKLGENSATETVEGLS